MYLARLTWPPGSLHVPFYSHYRTRKAGKEVLEIEEVNE